MRLWAQQLIPYLDRQRLLGQHRECCALRGAGWGRPHATVNYVFNYAPDYLFAYHCLIMTEMEARGYHPDPVWKNPNWRGSTLGEDNWMKTINETSPNPPLWSMLLVAVCLTNESLYKEHNDEYLKECIELLKTKEAPIDFKKLEKELKLSES